MSATNVTPVLVDRCCPRCRSKGGRRSTFLDYRTFNHHHFARHFTNERENKEILKEFTGHLSLVCSNPKCLTRVKKQPKICASATEMVLHLIKEHFGEEDQKLIYKLIDERFPVSEEEKNEDDDFGDNVSVRSQITDYSRASYSATPMQMDPLYSSLIPPMPALIPRVHQSASQGMLSKEEFKARWPHVPITDYFDYVEEQMRNMSITSHQSIVRFDQKPSSSNDAKTSL